MVVSVSFVLVQGSINVTTDCEKTKTPSKFEFWRKVSI